MRRRGLNTRLSDIAKGSGADIFKSSRRKKHQKGQPTMRISKGAGLPGSPVSLFADIVKIDPEKRMVYGKASNEGIDKQDEIVEWDATKKALVDFKKWRNLREMHKDDTAAGTIPVIEEDDINKELTIGAKVVDDGAWEKVKTGVYKGFSIGGKALDRAKEFNAKLGKNISRVKDYIMTEISLVDRPANPDCLFSMIKREAFVDPLQKELEDSEELRKKLKRYVLDEDDINELDDDEFGLVKNYSKGGRNIVERSFPIPDKPHARAVLKNLMNEDISDRERQLVHDRCRKVLKKAHKEENCPYCIEVMSLAKRRGGEEMSKELAEIKKSLSKASRMLRDYEGVEKPVSDQVESEDLKLAPQKNTRTAGVDPLEGSKYSDMEGLSLEDLEGLEEMLDAEGWDGDDGYAGNENLDTDTNETHVYNDDTEVDEDQKSPDTEDSEGIDDDDLYESVGKSESCPYCAIAMKTIYKGDAAQVRCPGCDTIYGADPHLAATLSKRSPRGGGKMRKSVDLSDTGSVISDLANVVGQLSKRLIRIEKRADRTPAPRKTMAKRDEEFAEEDIAKREAAMEEAIELRKTIDAEGRQPTPAEARKMEKALDANLAAKFNG